MLFSPGVPERDGLRGRPRGRPEVGADRVSNREQRRLRRGGGDSEQLSDLALLGQVHRRPDRSQTAGSKREQETPAGRNDRRPGRRRNQLVGSVDTAFQARDYMNRNVGECLGKSEGALVHPPGKSGE